MFRSVEIQTTTSVGEQKQERLVTKCLERPFSKCKLKLSFGKRLLVSAVVCTCMHNKLRDTKADSRGATCGQRLYTGHRDTSNLTYPCGDACVWDSGNPSDRQSAPSAACSTALGSVRLLVMQLVVHAGDGRAPRGVSSEAERGRGRDPMRKSAQLAAAQYDYSPPVANTPEHNFANKRTATQVERQVGDGSRRTLRPEAVETTASRRSACIRGGIAVLARPGTSHRPPPLPRKPPQPFAQLATWPLSNFLDERRKFLELPFSLSGIASREQTPLRDSPDFCLQGHLWTGLPCLRGGGGVVRGHGGVVARLLAIHPGEPDSIPGRDPRVWESCRTMPLFGGCFSGIPPHPSFRRCAILTSLRPRRLSRPRCQPVTLVSFPEVWSAGLRARRILANRSAHTDPDLPSLSSIVISIGSSLEPWPQQSDFKGVDQPTQIDTPFSEETPGLPTFADPHRRVTQWYHEELWTVATVLPPFLPVPSAREGTALTDAITAPTGCSRLDRITSYTLGRAGPLASSDWLWHLRRIIVTPRQAQQKQTCPNVGRVSRIDEAPNPSHFDKFYRRTKTHRSEPWAFILSFWGNLSTDLDVDLDSQLPADRDKPFEMIGSK
ncbi:hypothetical protein PR048_004395 [Dryococelus australis]|uniref:Uncharacterized protein n=1 Tax=Dryococelus australis TaxID=614101 RepID=A0ABQ9I5D2_9NEOP|nr:hypothetical protein PR048_004395 [Dryococelus australis]